MSDLLHLALVFLRIGLLAFGGSTGVLPELQRQVVQEQGWLTSQEFADSFALGQLTPGPALLMVMFAGFKIAGTPGAIVSMVAIFLPSTIMTCLVTASWDRLKCWPWLASVQRALAAMALGLAAAGAYSIVRVTVTDLVSTGVAIVAFFLLWRWRLPSALVILAGGLGALAIGLATG